jgi:hypothetical protein
MLCDLLTVDFGPFTPLMACIFSLGAVAYSIRRSFLGKKQIWQTQHNALPKTVVKLANIGTIAGIVLIYISATPAVLTPMWHLLIVLVVCAVLFYVLYYFFSNGCTCEMVVGVQGQQPIREKRLCGLWLTQAARKAKRDHPGTTNDDLLFGSAGNIYLVWSRWSIEMARLVLILLFVGIMLSGSLLITMAGCVLQVKLTDKPAYEIFKKSDVPGFRSDSTHLGDSTKGIQR